MALFDYRTPAETALSKFTSEEQSRISNAAVGRLAELEKTSSSHFSYAMKPWAKRRLTEAGCYLSVHSFVPHSHPVCKTIENHLLLNVLPSYLSPDFLVISMKRNKLAWLRHKTGFDMLSICNRFVSSKDPFRYGLDKYFEEAKSHITENVPEISEPNTLRDLVPRALRKKNRRFLLHDELHYWSLDDLNNFLVLVKPEVVVATHVCPKEVLVGCKESLNPWAYTYKIKERTLLFYPDGVLEEGYEQPLSGAYILTMGRFVTSEGDFYTIDVPYNLFSHSVVTITKGKLTVPLYRSFSRFDATFGDNLDHFGGTAGDILRIRPEFLKNLYLYLHTLKKPDKQSAVAKMRQMCVDPSGFEIRFIEDFAQFVLNVDPTGDMITQTLMHRFHKFILDLYPDFWRKNSKVFQETSLSKFIEELQEFYVQIKVVGCYEHKYFHQIICEELKHFYDLVTGNLEGMERETSIQRGLIKGRKRRPYFWLSDKKKGIVKVETCAFRRRTRFDCPIFKLFHANNRMFCENFRSKMLARITHQELMDFLLPFGLNVVRKFEELGKLGMYRLCKKIFNEFFVCENIEFGRVYFLEAEPIIDITGDWEEVTEEATKDPNLFKKVGKNRVERNSGREEEKQSTDTEEELKQADHKVIEEVQDDSEEEEEFVESAEELVEQEEDEFTDELSSNHQISETGSVISKEQEKCTIFGVIFEIDSEHYEEERAKLSSVETKADGDCFWHCLSCRFGGDVEKLRKNCLNFFLLNFSSEIKAEEVERVSKLFEPKVWAENEVIALAASFLNSKIHVFSEDHFVRQSYIPVSGAENEVMVSHKFNHFSVLFPRNICVIRSIADSLDRKEFEVFNVINKSGKKHIVDAINEGKGLPYDYLEELFKLFNVNAILHEEGSESSYNEDGVLIRHFQLQDKHLSFMPEGRVNSRIKMDRREPIKELPAVSRNLVLKRLKVSPIQFKPSLDRALNLQESFLDGFTGKILSRTFGNREEWIKAENQKLRETEIYPFVGTFGSGKSYMVKKMIRENPLIRFLVISPRKALAEAFRDELDEEKDFKPEQVKGETFSSVGYKELRKLKQLDTSKGSGRKNFRIVTFEVALMKKIEEEVQIIIDEAQLFPPGYLDLLLIYNKAENLILLGDPAQSSYDNESDRFKFIGLRNDLLNVLEGKRYQYLSLSRRFHNPFFIGRLPCSFEMKGKMEEVGYFIHKDIRHEPEMINSYDAILVPSFEDKQLLMLVLKKKKVPIYTYGESTGLTFNRGAILLNDSTRKVGEERILVALSRFRLEINFINNSGISFEEFIQSCNSQLLINFCTKRADLNDLRMYLPGEPIFVRSFNLIGHDEIDREERLEGDPWLKTMIFLGQRPEVMNFEGELEVEPKEEIMKSHQPIHTIQSVRAGLCDKFRERMGREMRIKDLITDQFRDSYFCKDVRQTSNQCELFEAIYPRHRNNDTATFLMAVQKRLSFDTPEANMANFRASRNSGKIMLEVFKQFVPITPERNPLLLEQAENEFEMKKLSKAKAVIENHSGRSSSDWNVCEAFVFMKSQLCTKYEKRFCDAKAGQTLACFSHIVLCRFAPWIRYIEKKVNEVLPKNFYIHNGKNFDELNNFVIERGFKDDCTESDYEAFDASQDVNIMSFEVELMKFFQIPEDVISDYIYIKANLFSKLGNFAVMRFTGEAGTFLFNTLANMVFTFMRYDLSGSESICFAGDDMCANKPLRVKHEFADLLNKLKLKAKVEIKSEATFCGWVLTKDGIYKKPQLVQERFEISKERDTFFDCLENYAIEVSYAYRMSEKGLLIMSEEEQESQHLCVREVVKHKKFLKSWVSEIFESVM